MGNGNGLFGEQEPVQFLASTVQMPGRVKPGPNFWPAWAHNASSTCAPQPADGSENAKDWLEWASVFG